MANILEFLKDAGKALIDILAFIGGFFEFAINFIRVIPSPFREILLVGFGLIGAITIYKVVRRG